MYFYHWFAGGEEIYLAWPVSLESDITKHSGGRFEGTAFPFGMVNEMLENKFSLVLAFCLDGQDFTQ